MLVPKDVGVKIPVAMVLSSSQVPSVSKAREMRWPLALVGLVVLGFVMRPEMIFSFFALAGPGVGVMELEPPRAAAAPPRSCLRGVAFLLPREDVALLVPFAMLELPRGGAEGRVPESTSFLRATASLRTMRKRPSIES